MLAGGFTFQNGSCSAARRFLKENSSDAVVLVAACKRYGMQSSPGGALGMSLAAG